MEVEVLKVSNWSHLSLKEVVNGIVTKYLYPITTNFRMEDIFLC